MFRFDTIYLDIDGTIISDEPASFGNPALFLDEFLFALNQSDIDVYWLTTHCMDGNLNNVYNYLSKFLTDEQISLTYSFLPTVWSENKTEALDLSTNFLWIDDDIYTEEREFLNKNKLMKNIFEINLKDDPKALCKVLEILQI